MGAKVGCILKCSGPRFVFGVSRRSVSLLPETLRDLGSRLDEGFGAKSSKETSNDEAVLSTVGIDSVSFHQQYISQAHVFISPSHLLEDGSAFTEDWLLIAVPLGTDAFHLSRSSLLLQHLT
ncbi:hypothetical protein TNIN_173031 [Trichonephila inaurata madagascariensis]|uniref:Uncharacterized protein n=1 Tax=Trichonephila inaurata madagascariensis TaxID=2747483 RepID=A0A8X7BXP4_9ARAC|nr:hypothetical protein TNIN_173031 [Trichonephila inaurata madagascariensis]